MADNQSETVLIYRVDDASINKAESRLKDLEKSNESLKKSLDKTGDVASSVSKELERIGRQSKIDEIVKDAKTFEKKTKDTDAAVKQLTADLEKMGATGAEAQQAAGQFGNNDVGGRFKKGVLGEIGTAARNAPAIPIPGTGITTEPISKAAIALDRMGVSIADLGVAAPIAAVAIGAIMIAVGRFTEEMKKQADQLNAVINARREVGQDIAGGLTSSDAATKQDELNAKRTQEAALLDELKKQYDSQITSQNDLFETVLRLTPQEEALANQIDQSQASVTSYDTAIKALQTAHDDGTLAANDAAQAERDLAAERTKGILQASQSAGELEAARQSTSGKTQEDIQAQIAAEQNRAAQLQASLDVLKASGDSSKEVAAQMASLQSQLDLSAQKVSIFKDALSGAGTAQDAAVKSAIDSKKKEVDLNKALNASSEATALGLGKLDDSIKKVGTTAETKAPPSMAELNRKLAIVGGFPTGSKSASGSSNDAAKAAQDYQKKLVDINRDLIHTFNDIGTGLADSLQDLKTQTKRDIRDALAGGDFLSIRDIQRKAKDDRADLETKAARDRRDAQIKANQELYDLQGQFLQASIAQLQGAIASIKGGSTASKTGGLTGSFIGLTPRS